MYVDQMTRREPSEPEGGVMADEDAAPPALTPVRGVGRPLPEQSVRAVRELLDRLTAMLGEAPRSLPGGPLDHASAQAALLTGWDAAREALTGCLGSPARAGDAEALIALLGELRVTSDQLRDEQWRERESSFERVREMLALLREVDSTTELVDQAVIAVCQLGFDRAIVSRVENSLWVAQSVYVGRDVRWAEEILNASKNNPQIIDAGLVEAEIVRTGRSVLVPDVQEQIASINRPIAEASLSRAYVAAPIVAHGTVVGFLHADCYYQGRELDETDRAILALFGEGLGYALARTAVLERLTALRADLGSLASGLSSGGSELWPPDGERPEPAPRRLILPDSASGLTRREIDVLQWMARGETNARIARRLVITEGTVKSHVQSILRKLGAANRAEAVSVWSRLEGRGRER